MQDQCSKAKGIRYVGAVCMVLLLVLVSSPALAKTINGKVTTKTLKIYAKPTGGSKVLCTLKKGDAVKVVGIKGKWARVKSNAKVGYVLKKGIKKAEKPAKKAAGTTIARVQARLVSKGYLKTSAATGSSNEATSKAIRNFQAFNKLSITGKANTATLRKLFSSKARKAQKVNTATWAKSGINSAIHRRGLATVLDMETGARLQIRRVGGHNHLDVEPKTKADTEKLKKVYGGAWSWDSRPILLTASGRYYAAAMNGMPHGAEISKNNGFDGQFCIHLNGSLTHGSEKLNAAHQANIDKVSAYFN